MTEVLENELQCIICSELFIEVRVNLGFTNTISAVFYFCLQIFDCVWGNVNIYSCQKKKLVFSVRYFRILITFLHWNKLLNLHWYRLQAVILNCAHSFCCHCIKQWRKKKDECPICRQAIQSQTRCLALDNCINSMVENLSLDMKARRQTLITERKGERCVTSILDS